MTEPTPELNMVQQLWEDYRHSLVGVPPQAAKLARASFFSGMIASHYAHVNTAADGTADNDVMVARLEALRRQIIDELIAATEGMLGALDPKTKAETLATIRRNLEGLDTDPGPPPG